MTTVIPEPDIIIKQDLIEPTDDETEWAIQMLKNGKSPGEDDIVSELLKKGGQAFKQANTLCKRYSRRVPSRIHKRKIYIGPNSHSKTANGKKLRIQSRPIYSFH